MRESVEHSRSHTEGLVVQLNISPTAHPYGRAPRGQLDAEDQRFSQFILERGGEHLVGDRFDRDNVSRLDRLQGKSSP